jgi:hypothetical protein
MREAAEWQAKTLMQNVINPEISNFRDRVNEQVKNFQASFEKSQNYLQQRVEALNPYRQPIVAVTATIQIAVKSDQQVRSHVSGQGAFMAFVKGANQILGGGSMEYDTIQSGEGFIYYTSNLKIYIDSSARGLSVSSLQDTEFIKLTFHGIPNNSEILGGGFYCTINSSIPLVFSIPAQIAQGKDITVPDIHKVLQGLKP